MSLEKWFTYDKNNNLILQKNSNNFLSSQKKEEIKYVYNKKNQLIKEIYSDGIIGIYKYDKKGNNIYFSSKNNYEIFYTFDEKNNVIFSKLIQKKLNKLQYTWFENEYNDKNQLIKCKYYECVE